MKTNQSFKQQAPTSNPSQPSPIEIIWGTRILDEGFTSIPNILVRNYRSLGIEHGEWGLICTLLSYKHDNRDPFPEQETLAGHLQVSVRQVRKWTDSLVDKGLLRVGRRRHNQTKQFGALVYNLLPLINRVLELVGDKPLSPSVDDFDIEYTSSDPAVPEVPVGRTKPAVLQVPVAFSTDKPRRDAENSIFLPAVSEVPHKRIIKKTSKTTTTKTTRARTNPNFRITRQNSHTKESIVQRIQAKIATHLPQHKSTDMTGETSRVTTDSVLNESLSHSVYDWSVSSSSQNQPSIPLLHDTDRSEPRHQANESSTNTCQFLAPPNQNFIMRGPLATNLNSDSARNPYTEIEFLMQKNLVRPYIAKENDYRAIKELLVSDVPLDWILGETQRQFDLRPDCRHKARSFGYMAEILKDSWQCELAKKAPVEPLDFESYRTSSSRRQQKRAGRPETKATPTAPVQDERYANFYRLFPEETCYDNETQAATAAAHDKRYEAFYKLFPNN